MVRTGRKVSIIDGDNPARHDRCLYEDDKGELFVRLNSSYVPVRYYGAGTSGWVVVQQTKPRRNPSNSRKRRADVSVARAAGREEGIREAAEVLERLASGRMSVSVVQQRVLANAKAHVLHLLEKEKS